MTASIQLLVQCLMFQIQSMVVQVLIRLMYSNENPTGTANTTGDAVTLAIDIYHTNIEKITVVDYATDDNAGDVTITIAAAFTGTALTIDASALDQNALTH